MSGVTGFFRLIVSGVRTVIGKVPNLVTKTVKFVPGNIRKSFDTTKKSGSLWISIGSTVYGWVSWLLPLVLGIAFWILKTVLGRILPSFIKNVVDDWQDNRLADYAERRERSIREIQKFFKIRVLYVPALLIAGTFEFIIQFIGVLFYAFVIKWLKFIVDHLVVILVLFFISGVMFFFRMHLPGATSVYQETAVAGLESLNAGSSVGNAVMSGLEIVTPYNNFMMYSSISILIQIQEGASYAASTEEDEGVLRRFLQTMNEEEPVSRRSLFSDDRSAGEKFVEFVLNVLIVVSSFGLQFTLIVIDVFFRYIFPYLDDFFGIIVFLLRRIGCYMSGQFCGVLEILDAILNLFWTPLESLFGKLPIACGADQLLRVRCDCSGYFWDFGHYGVFRNLEPCGTADKRFSNANFNEYEEANNRRVLISCSKNADGDFVEEINGQASLSKTSDITKACPTARRAFQPYAHAQDLERFDVNDCFTHCVMGVALSSCDDGSNHTVSLMGTCSEDDAADEIEVKKRLAFLGTDVLKIQPYEPPKRKLQPRDPTPWERIQRLRELIPTRFTLDGFGECDLSSMPSNPYQMYDTLRCMVGREFKQNSNGFIPWKNTRRLESVVNDAAHSARKIKRSLAVKDVRNLYDSSDRVVSMPHYFLWESVDRVRRRLRQRRAKRRNLQFFIPEGEDPVTFAPSASPTVFDDPNTDPVNPADPIPCLGRVLCPDQVTCAVDAKYCTKPKENSPIVLYSYYVQKFSSGIKNFDAYAEIARAKACYQNREAKGTSPYDPLFVFKSYEEKLRDKSVKYCPGEIAPSDYRFPTVNYKVNEDLQHFCSGTENFDGCRCPDFWDTRGGAVDYSGVSSDVLYVLGNGLKWFAYIIWLVLNFVADVVDNILESAGLPNFTRASTSAYGLTDREFGVCVFLHTGDAAALVLFLLLLWGILKSGAYVLDWINKTWLDPAEFFFCVPDPGSYLSKYRNAKNIRPFDRMKKEWDIESKRILDNPTESCIVLPFNAYEFRAAKRMKRFLNAGEDRIDLKRLKFFTRSNAIDIKNGITTNRFVEIKTIAKDDDGEYALLVDLTP